MSVTDADHREQPAATMLSRLRGAARGDRVSVRDLVTAAGPESFAMLLFVAAMLIVTPLSAIPTVPTLSAVLIGLTVGQWALGRGHIWLPDWITRRSIATARLRRSLDWAQRPARFIDRNTRVRLAMLARPPLSYLAFGLILATVATWPFLELLPLFTSVTGLGIALMAIGLATHDGLWLLAGYAYAAALATAALWVI